MSLSLESSVIPEQDINFLMQVRQELSSLMTETQDRQNPGKMNPVLLGLCLQHGFLLWATGVN